MATTATTAPVATRPARRTKPATGAPAKRAKRTKQPKPARRSKAASAASTGSQVTVGHTLVQRVEGHAARTDSREFRHARAALHKIVRTLRPNPFGTGAVQAHHGGSIWVHDGAGDGGWHLVLNWAGIEWSAQFCCDPDKVDRLRRNAEAITHAFPATIPALQELGYPDADLLTTPVTDARSIARYVDSIWNSCVPIPEPAHIGVVTKRAPRASGVHSYPEPVCAIPRVMHDDFVPFVVDPLTKTTAVVAPVSPRGAGDGRVRVLFAERGNPLWAKRQKAHRQGRSLVLPPTHAVARRAFALQPG
jgi:hypothetical protein